MLGRKNDAKDNPMTSAARQRFREMKLGHFICATSDSL